MSTQSNTTQTTKCKETWRGNTWDVRGRTYVGTSRITSRIYRSKANRGGWKATRGPSTNYQLGNPRFSGPSDLVTFRPWNGLRTTRFPAADLGASKMPKKMGPIRLSILGTHMSLQKDTQHAVTNRDRLVAFRQC